MPAEGENLLEPPSEDPTAPEEENLLTAEKITLIPTRYSEGAVAVSGNLPENGTMRGTPVRSGLAGKRVLAAYDITLYSDKEMTAKWQPGAEGVTVSVSSSNFEGVALVGVYHMTEGGPVLEAMEEPISNSISFTAKSFSIYLFVEENPETPEQGVTVTYKFMVGGELFKTEILRPGDTIQDPGIPPLGDNQTFRGWYVGDNQLVIGSQIPEDQTVSTTITATAKITTTYYVTFYGTDGEIVEVKEVLLEGGVTSVSVSTADVTVIPKLETQTFKGWQDADGAPVGNAVTVTNSNILLYPIVVNSFWITFDENDGGTGATYTPPVAVEQGHPASEGKPGDPTRTGYTFDGWCRDAAGTQPFDWSTSMTGPVYLYARWKPKADTTYTVIIWRQKVTDGKNIPDANKTYDFVERILVENATTDMPVTAALVSSYTGYSYTGFHYRGWDANSETIQAKGDTILNVYYDRNLNTINFFLWQSSGWFDGSWVLQNTMTMTGLYGQTLAQNGYTWPSDHYWYENGHGTGGNQGTTWGQGEGTTSGQRTTFLDSFKDENTTVSLYGDDNQGGRLYIRHYKQNVDGTYSEAANETRSGDGTWTFTEKYDGFTVKYYRIGNGNWIETSAGNSVEFDRNLHIRYTRNNYDLSFADTFGGVVAVKKTVEGIPYEQELSDYLSQAPDLGTHNGFQFDGWYEDSAGSVPFDWDSTMPAANKVVYAKWEKVKFKVKLDPNGGRWVSGQAPYTEAEYEETLSRTTMMGSVVRDNWELVGWFDVETDAPYAYGKVTADVNLYAKWRFPGVVKIAYDVGEHGSEPPVDNGNYTDTSTFVVGAPPEQIHEDYMFLGWRIKGADSTTAHYPNDAVKIPAEAIVSTDPKVGVVTLEAVYRALGETPFATTSIKFDPNHGDGLGGEIKNLQINQNVTALGKEAAGERPGYVFIGWSKIQKEGSYSDSEVFCGAGAWIFADNEGLPNTLYAAWRQTLSVLVQGDTKSFTYDGSEQRAEGFTVTYTLGTGAPTTTPPEGVSVTLKEGITATAARTNVGTTPMGLNENSFDLNGVQNLTVDKFTVEDGTLEITPRAVTFTGETATRTYTGSEIELTGITVTGLGLVAGHTHNVTYSAKGTAVGTYPGTIRPKADIRIMEGANDVTGNYDISAVPGTLTITPITEEYVITVTGNSDTKGYTGAEQAVNGYTYSAYDASIAVTGPAQDSEKATAKGTDAGTYTMTLAAADFTAASPNYTTITIVVVPGTLVIAPTDDPLTVTMKDSTYTYDGQAHWSAEEAITNAIGGKTYIYYSKDGTSWNTVLSNYTATDVADSCTIHVLARNSNYKNEATADAKLTILPRPISVTAGNREAEYDGSEQTGETTYTFSNLVKDHVGTITYTPAKGTLPGTYTGAFDKDGKVTSADNKDVTANYSLTDIPGTLTIKDRENKYEITVVAKSTNVVYDGVEHSATGFETLTFTVEGHTYTVEGLTTSDPKSTDVVALPNAISGTPKVKDAGGNDVTAQFTVKTEDGKLEITPRAVTFTGETATRTYTGSEIELTGITVTGLGLVAGHTHNVTYSAKGTAVGTYPGTIRPKADIRIMEGANDVTGNYDISAVPGTLTITPITEEYVITVTGNSDTKGYTGAEQAVNGYTYSAYDASIAVTGPAQDSEKATAKGTDAGTYTMTLAAADFTAASPNYTTITIVVVPGTLTITPITEEVTVTVTENSRTDKYDGTKQTLTGYTVAISNPLYTEDSFSFHGSDVVEGTDAGTYDMALKAEEFVNMNPNFTNVVFLIVDGQLTIGPRNLILTSATDSKVYDGTPLINGTVTVSGDGFAAAEGADYSVTGSQILVGESENTFTYALQAGTKATNYIITLSMGKLKITDGTEPGEPPVKDELVVTKTAEDKVYALGDTVTFQIQAINIYDEAKTITFVELPGVMLGQDTFSDVAPGATVATTATYVITEADLLNGGFTNTVTAIVGTLEKEASATAKTVTPSGHLTLQKDVTSTPKNGKRYGLGEEVAYIISVTNNGNLTITDIQVTDKKTGDKWTIPSLAPGEYAEFTTTYKVLEADLTAGFVKNVATATGTSPDPKNPKVPVTPAEARVITKKPAESVPEPPFTLAWFSDTLINAEGPRADALEAMTEWTAKNAEERNILGLLGTGSLVGTFNDSPTEKKAVEAISRLKQVKTRALRFYGAAGAFDVGGDEMNYTPFFERNLLVVNGNYRKGEVWYQLFRRQQIMVLGIGYRKLAETDQEKKAQDEWINFVNKAISAQSGYSVILLVDGFVDEDEKLTPLGELIEEQIVSKRSNVRLILSSCQADVIRTSLSYGARTVNVLAFNYAKDEQNGLGFLRLLSFDSENRTISVTTYSPVLDKNVYDENEPRNDTFLLDDAF